jgi:hypothetical protein
MSCKCPLQLKNWIARWVAKHPFFHNVGPIKSNPHFLNDFLGEIMINLPRLYANIKNLFYDIDHLFNNNHEHIDSSSATNNTMQKHEKYDHISD